MDVGHQNMKHSFWISGRIIIPLDTEYFPEYPIEYSGKYCNKTPKRRIREK